MTRQWIRTISPITHKPHTIYIDASTITAIDVHDNSVTAAGREHYVDRDTALWLLSDGVVNDQNTLTDAELFRFWIKTASESPIILAKRLAECITPEQYRDALHDLFTSRRAGPPEADVKKAERDRQLGTLVWSFIDRMTDHCDVDRAETILDQFAAKALNIINGKKGD